MTDITGRQVELSNGRSVFVGRSDSDDQTYIRFINSQAEETRFKISPEARNALVTLLSVDAVFDRVGEKWYKAVRSGGWGV